MRLEDNRIPGACAKHRHGVAGLLASDLVERDVAGALQAAFGVPIGLPMANESKFHGSILALPHPDCLPPTLVGEVQLPMQMRKFSGFVFPGPLSKGSASMRSSKG